MRAVRRHACTEREGARIGEDLGALATERDGDFRETEIVAS
jgi:hypothetical protein